MPSCRAIGYPNQGTAAFPANEKKRKEWFDALSTKTVHRQQINANPNAFQLAFWHFRPEHRVVDKKGDGAWSVLRNLPAWKDNEGKTWTAGAVPINPLANFVQLERSRRAPPCTRVPLPVSTVTAKVLSKSTNIQTKISVAVKKSPISRPPARKRKRSTKAELEFQLQEQLKQSRKKTEKKKQEPMNWLSRKPNGNGLSKRTQS